MEKIALLKALVAALLLVAAIGGFYLNIISKDQAYAIIIVALTLLGIKEAAEARERVKAAKTVEKVEVTQ